MGKRAQRGRRGGDCGRDARADEADRTTARRDPVLGARLLEGTRCRSGRPVGLRGSVWSTVQRQLNGVEGTRRGEEGRKVEDGR